MKILFSNDYIIDEAMIKKNEGLIVLGDKQVQILPVGKEEVSCFDYGQLVSVTIEVLKEVLRTRILIFDIATRTKFTLNLNLQTIHQHYELEVDLTVDELKKLFELLDKQEIVIHDPVHLQNFYKQKKGSLQAFVAKQLEELYPF